MTKRFNIMIEDDWEVMGNGLGNVASIQYLPSMFFMKLAKRLGIQFTFMVDVAQQLIFNQYVHNDQNIKLQKHLWDDTVQLMKSYGFDVQLHLHPQWLNATRKDDFFYLGNNWNIGRCAAQEQADLIREAVQYLENLLKPIDPNYQVIGYKGGSWGLQPSGDLLRNLANHGIRVVTGVREGMYLPCNGVDYRSLEEVTMPYHPDYDDLCKISAKREAISIIPLHTVVPGFKGLTYLALDMAKRKMAKKDAQRHFYDSDIPKAVSDLSPIAEESKPKFPFVNYRTHLKIGNQPYSYLKSSFDQVIKRLSNTPHQRIPVLIECHTKQYNGYYGDIERFLSYVVERYGDVADFSSMTDFVREIDRQPDLVKTKSTYAPLDPLVATA